MNRLEKRSQQNSCAKVSISEFSNKKLTAKIGIFGHVGRENLGDESIFAAVIENVYRWLPDAKIYGFSLNPRDTTKRHGILSFPIRRLVDLNANERSQAWPAAVTSSKVYYLIVLLFHFKIYIKKKPNLYRFITELKRFLYLLRIIPLEVIFLTKCYKNIKGLNLLIIAGSQQLIDYAGNGPWDQAYTILKWSIISRIANVKVAFMSVGAGPIHTNIGRSFFKTALKIACYRSYRDQTSLQWVQRLNIKKKLIICPDLAFSNSKLFNLKVDFHKTFNQRIVGLNAVPIYDKDYWLYGGQDAYKNYIEIMIMMGLWLIKRGYKVQLFPTQLNLDREVMHDIRQGIKKKGLFQGEQMLLDKPIHSLEGLIKEISSMDYVVASRYHSCILAYCLNKPVLGIAYQKKTHDLMSFFGSANWALDIRKLQLDQMTYKFTKLEQQYDQIKNNISLNVNVSKKLLKNQYAQVFELID